MPLKNPPPLSELLPLFLKQTLQPKVISGSQYGLVAPEVVLQRLNREFVAVVQLRGKGAVTPLRQAIPGVMPGMAKSPAGRPDASGQARYGDRRDAGSGENRDHVENCELRAQGY